MVEHASNSGGIVLIFIANTPRAYAWGDKVALPDFLGRESTGEPQAELWLGDHPGSPASVAKATPEPHTLIELIAQDPEHYGVRGGSLPFLLKVLAIGAPLSLQAHPNLEQARAGFAAENAAGIPLDAPQRNYRDDNHKPELLVALTEVTALSGFRPIAEAVADLRALAAGAAAAGAAAAGAAAAAAGVAGAGAAGAGAAGAGAAGAGAADTAASAGAAGLLHAAELLLAGEAEQVRQSFLVWAFSGAPEVADALAGIRASVSGVVSAGGSAAVAGTGPESAVGSTAPAVPTAPAAPASTARAALGALPADRLDCIVDLVAHYPDDPGVLVSLLLHHVTLEPGEAIYLGARQLHAYLGGTAVEVMATSDNVLRAGLTVKHVDVAEMLRVLDWAELAEPRQAGVRPAPGLCEWQPDIPDFKLMRARVNDAEADHPGSGHIASEHAEFTHRLFGDYRLDDAAPEVVLDASTPLVLIVTAGRVLVSRPDAEIAEMANVARGQSLYVSAGEPIHLSGNGEAFLATVGD